MLNLFKLNSSTEDKIYTIPSGATRSYQYSQGTAQVSLNWYEEILTIHWRFRLWIQNWKWKRTKFLGNRVFEFYANTNLHQLLFKGYDCHPVNISKMTQKNKINTRLILKNSENHCSIFVSKYKWEGWQERLLTKTRYSKKLLRPVNRILWNSSSGVIYYFHYDICIKQVWKW